MTFPLYGLAIYIIWTIAIVVLLLTVRIRHLAMGGSIKDFSVQNDESLLWRLLRVHANLVENLPLYGGVVFLLAWNDVSGMAVNSLVVVYLVFRLAHSIVHIAGMNPIFRLFSLAIQLVCLVALTFLAMF